MQPSCLFTYITSLFCRWPSPEEAPGCGRCLSSSCGTPWGWAAWPSLLHEASLLHQCQHPIGASLFPTCLQPRMALPWKPTFSALFICFLNLSGRCCRSPISEGAAAPEGKFSCRSLWRNLHQSNRGHGPWHLHFAQLLCWQKRVEGSNLSHFCLKIFSLSDVKISVDLWQDQRL